MGVDAQLDLRVQRLLKLHREPRQTPTVIPRTKTSVLARAMEWQRMLRLPGIGNRAGLAAKLGVSRARVTQGMAVLAVPGQVLDAMQRLEARGEAVTESIWRKVSRLPVEDAVRMLGAR